MDLCNNCCRMIQAVIKRDSNGYWNTKQQYFCKLVELAESAQHCPLCSVFHSNIPKDVPNDGLGWNASWVPLQDGLSQLSIDVPHAASDWLVTYPQPDEAGRPCSINPDIWEKPIWECSPPTIDHRFSLVGQWLSECLKTHHVCQVKTSGYPRRLLCLDRTNHGDLRLVETSGFGNLRPDYTTLSHCWGQAVAELLQTTKSNRKFHQAGICFTDLPSTFRDAANITRRLGIEYIWIDSLCILQDDPEDWQTEAANMSAIYQNSFLNIAATSSANCNGGCFLDTPPGITVAVNIQGADGSECEVKVRRAQQERAVPLPLNLRAWAFQEAILAPRTLHMTAFQMLWSCRKCIASEDASLDFWSTFGDRDESVPSIYRSSNLISAMAEYGVTWEGYTSNVPEFYENRWHRWAEEYSRRSLTFEHDKLPALAGIIRYYQAQTKYTEMLGLWKETFDIDLDWEVSTASETKISGIPSWTWLSSTTDVYYWDSEFLLPPHLRVDRLSVVAWISQWSGPPFTSQLQATLLKVSSKILPITLSKALKSYDSAGLNSEISRLLHRLSFYCSLDGTHTSYDSNKVMLLLLYAKLNPDNQTRGHLRFLILYRTSTWPTTYIRIGCGKLHAGRHPSKRAVSLDELFDTLETREIQLV